LQLDLGAKALLIFRIVDPARAPGTRHRQAGLARQVRDDGVVLAAGIGIDLFGAIESQHHFVGLPKAKDALGYLPEFADLVLDRLVLQLCWLCR
jgi:hypothetical protein